MSLIPYKTSSSWEQRFKVWVTKGSVKEGLTLFDLGGVMMTPQNVFDHCAQTPRRRKLKFGDF